MLFDCILKLNKLYSEVLPLEDILIDVYVPSFSFFSLE